MKIKRFLSVLALLCFSLSSHSALIPYTEVTASTTMSIDAYWPLYEISDGVTVDDPATFWKGFATTVGVTTGTIELSLNSDYAINGFSLWNDINVANEGVRSFKLHFFNSAGSLLGSTAIFNAISQLAVQEYSFGLINNVRRVDMEILSSSARVEIREVAFSFSSAVSVPEPSLLALMGIGLIGLGLTRRRKIKD